MARADEPVGRSDIEWIDDGDEIGIGSARLRSPFTTRIWTIALVVAALVGAGVWYVVKPRPPLVVTFSGATVDNAALLIAQADTSLAQFTTRDHGVLTRDSRCYFDRVGGSATSDISSSLYCGPVLFYGGKAPALYLPYQLLRAATNTPTAGHVSLTLTETPTSSPVPIPDGARLERPDRRSPPRGADGLTPPGPPPVATDFVGRVDPQDIPALHAAPPGALIGSRSMSLRLRATGFVDTIGTGPDTHSPPAGGRLLAFVLEPNDGEVGQLLDGDAEVSVSIDGAPGAPVLLGLTPEGDQDFVAAVPAGARSVDLVVSEAGVTQRLSLLTGVPGTENIAVLRRSSLAVPVNATATIDATVTAPDRTFRTQLTMNAVTAQLGYFSALGDEHAQGPDGAWLSVDVLFESPDPSGQILTAAGTTSAITLTPAAGAPVHAIDPTHSGDRVFAVSAEFTSGTVTVSGPLRTPNGWTITLATPFRFTIDIPK